MCVRGGGGGGGAQISLFTEKEDRGSAWFHNFAIHINFSGQ